MTTRRAFVNAARRAAAWGPVALVAIVAVVAAQTQALSLSPASRPSSATASAASSAAAPASAAASRPAAVRAAKPASAPATRAAATRSSWRELTPGQQQALAPLAAQWDTLNEAQKRKWIAMSANFPKLSPEEQAKLHSRMTEWVTLSPQQRTTARLNYGETRKLSADDKKAKWEAYQALPPEEKKRLAQKATAPKAPTTAAALRPVPRERLASVPHPRPNHETRTPRIASAPNQVDHNTLLPQFQAPAPAVAPPAVTAPAAPAVQPAVLPQPAPAQPSAHPLPPQAGTPD